MDTLIDHLRHMAERVNYRAWSFDEKDAEVCRQAARLLEELRLQREESQR